MSAMASQITSLTIVHSTVYSGADQRKDQSSVSLAFVSLVNSPHKGPVTRKMLPFDDVTMKKTATARLLSHRSHKTPPHSPVGNMVTLLTSGLVLTLKRPGLCGWLRSTQFKLRLDWVGSAAQVRRYCVDSAAQAFIHALAGCVPRSLQYALCVLATHESPSLTHLST